MKAIHKRILFCFLLNAIFFGVVLFFLKPIYNSGDNAICAYLLGGGFGLPPTELIYYNHVLHPSVTLIIKYFFTLNPNINWYTWCMVIVHFFATSLILVYINFKKSFIESLFMYTLLFLIFESNFLMSLSFTNTSIILTWAGVTALLFATREEKYSLRNYLLSCLCLVLAAAFRIHAIIPFMAMAFPFFFFPFIKRKIILFFAFVVVLATLITFLNQSHRSYYNKYIPGWKSGEAYRQKLYKFYNHEALYDVNIPEWETEKQLVMNTLILDTNYLSSKKLSAMYEAIVQQKSKISSRLNTDFVHWSFINNRIYFLAILFFFFFYAIRPYQKVIAGCSFMLLSTGIMSLMLFLKLPDYIIVGGTGLLCLLIFLYTDPGEQLFIKRVYIVKALFFCFLLFWGIIRLCKLNVDNKQKNDLFINASEEIRKHKDILFLVTDNAFPIDYFSIFDSPKKHSLENIALGWQYSQELNWRILSMLNIKTVTDIPHASNILIWGKPVQALLDYFQKTTGEKITFSPVLKEFKYGEVRKLQMLPDP